MLTNEERHGASPRVKMTDNRSGYMKEGGRKLPGGNGVTVWLRRKGTYGLNIPGGCNKLRGVRVKIGLEMIGIMVE